MHPTQTFLYSSRPLSSERKSAMVLSASPLSKKLKQPGVITALGKTSLHMYVHIHSYVVLYTVHTYTQYIHTYILYVRTYVRMYFLDFDLV